MRIVSLPLAFVVWKIRIAVVQKVAFNERANVCNFFLMKSSAYTRGVNNENEKEKKKKCMLMR